MAGEAPEAAEARDVCPVCGDPFTERFWADEMDQSVEPSTPAHKVCTTSGPTEVFIHPVEQ